MTKMKHAWFPVPLQGIMRVSFKSFWTKWLTIIRWKSENSLILENSKDLICGSVKTLMYIVTSMSILLALHLITSSRPEHLTSKGVLCFSANRPPVRRVDLTKDASNRPVQIVSIRSHLLPPLTQIAFCSLLRIDFRWDGSTLRTRTVFAVFEMCPYLQMIIFRS